MNPEFRHLIGSIRNIPLNNSLSDEAVLFSYICKYSYIMRLMVMALNVLSGQDYECCF